MLRIIAATRLDRLSFERHALLGRSLRRLAPRGEAHADIAYANARGLPEVFNAALACAADDDLVVFTHDDVRLNDWFLSERVRDALAEFSVVGVAGNRRRVARQMSWHSIDGRSDDERENLSGAVAHLRDALHEELRVYGPVPAPVRLLDGVFLASRASTLRSAGVAFDPQFPREFYDLDFCRTCEQAGLSLGTWPIAITHASPGKFGSPEWQQAYARYLAKWTE